MVTFNDLADLSKVSRQICGRRRFHRPSFKGIKANEVPFDELPVEIRIRRLKEALGPRTISITAYYVAFMGEWVSISKAEYEQYKACGMNVKQEIITQEL